ncbi:12783_t:CDS:2 [Funneliformis mosseae]|uniref:12783_t:CDS:1 n=1 Tax=Funneliformis mosseae TaxID=27381 RepID=A0A9N9N7E3_FUNMO|nr:12783_t:CDS:2 [Funneliformis mosseae]
MTGPDRIRKDRLNRDGKRPIVIHDEKTENGVDLYLVECRNPKVTWHWRPRNKIWGWRRLYDEFLLSKGHKYVNCNAIEPYPLSDDYRNQFIEPSYYDEKLCDNRDYGLRYHNDCTYPKDPTSEAGPPVLYHSDHSRRSSSSSTTSSYKCEHQSRHAWGTTEHEEPSFIIARVRKQYSSPPHHNFHHLDINEDFNRYYAPWSNKNEFEIALNKLDRYYQNLFYSKFYEPFIPIVYEASPISYDRSKFATFKRL